MSVNHADTNCSIRKKKKVVFSSYVICEETSKIHHAKYEGVMVNETVTASSDIELSESASQNELSE